jgi:hypothetical protein
VTRSSETMTASPYRVTYSLATCPSTQNATRGSRSMSATFWVVRGVLLVGYLHLLTSHSSPRPGRT